jgi:hypothetical protein
MRGNMRINMPNIRATIGWMLTMSILVTIVLPPLYATFASIHVSPVRAGAGPSVALQFAPIPEDKAEGKAKRQ